MSRDAGIEDVFSLSRSHPLVHSWFLHPPAHPSLSPVSLSVPHLNRPGVDSVYLPLLDVIDFHLPIPQSPPTKSTIQAQFSVRFTPPEPPLDNGMLSFHPSDHVANYSSVASMSTEPKGRISFHQSALRCALPIRPKYEAHLRLCFLATRQ